MSKLGGKRKNYLNWDEYFMSIAKLTAGRSKDPNTQVGACIVGSDNRVLSTGYNGAPNNFDDDIFPWDREGNPIDTKYMYVCHAEANAIISAPRDRMIDSTLYLTGIEVSDKSYIKNANSCSMCKRMVINAGIKTVVIRLNHEEYKTIEVSSWVENDESIDGTMGY